MTQELNMSNKRLVVDSLEILNDISGTGITSIKQSISSMQQTQKSTAARQERYWKKLSDDGIITPYEKTELLKEFRGIQQSFNAIFTQAQAQNLAGTDYFLFYKETYQELYTYLYTDLKLFDDMNKDTKLESRETFDNYFSSYYFAESSVNVSMAVGIFGNLGFKTLNSLDASGNEGDVGLYQGQIYQYTNGQWLAQGLEGYQGRKTSLPAISSENNYFLAEEDFNAALPVKVNDELLFVNGQQLYINVAFNKGVIYVSRGNGWRAVQDTTNYRYVVALVDYLNVTGELPGAYNVAIKNKVVETIGEEGLIDHIPQYLGMSPIDPVEVEEGDFYLYTGVSQDEPPRLYNFLYIFRNGDWEQLDQDNDSAYYMQALDDILVAADTTESSVFSSVFARSFFAHQGILNSLKTKTIYLSSTGAIQTESPGYVVNQAGMHIGANGHADFNEDVHIGGTCKIDGTTTINGNVTIGGNAKFSGEVQATSGTFRGTVYASSGSFTGSINAQSGSFNGYISASNGLSFSNGTVDSSISASALYRRMRSAHSNGYYFCTGAVVFVINDGPVGIFNICYVDIGSSYVDLFGYVISPVFEPQMITLHDSDEMTIDVGGSVTATISKAIYYM